ncbi:MAG: hypothetical protein JJV98_06270 [Desulfosarcina sp.]|nr:hypothetical protein [Desulfobacterales bacterium]
MKFLDRMNSRFERHMNLYWMNLSRFTTLLIILNISLFFLTELVTRHGYFYTYFSLAALLAIEFGLLAPVGLVHKLWYYGIYLFLEGVALYFLISSVWFWVSVNGV